MMDVLKALSDAPGLSGNEAAVRKIIREAIQDDVDEIRVDNLGNLIAVKRGESPIGSPKVSDQGEKGSGGDLRPSQRIALKRGEERENLPSALRVMVAAHMDEVGFMIVNIGSDGLLQFRTIGGIDPRIVLSKPVRIGDNGVTGIIGVKPVHLINENEGNQVPEIKNLAIDIGAKGQEEAKQSVKPGDYATFATRFEEVGQLVKGKAFDDRAGCAVLVELLKENYPFELYATFTVQEELGLRGARVAAYDINPDVAFVLEGTIADDLPKDRDTSSTTEIGQGPAITLMDRSFFADRRLVDLLVETAKANDIPYQFKQPGVAATDAGRIHLAREGIPSAVISVPCRYIHTPAALLSPEDLRHTIELVSKALKRLPEVWE